MSATPTPISEVPTGTTATDINSGTSGPTVSSSPVFTLPNNGSDHSTLRIVATIIPIVIIVAIVVWGLLVAAGVMQNRTGRRGLPMPHAPLHLYHEKRAEPQEEPKLWDVKYDVEEAKGSLEDLHVSSFCSPRRCGMLTAAYSLCR